MTRHHPAVEMTILALVLSLICIACWWLVQLVGFGPRYVNTPEGVDAVQVEAAAMPAPVDRRCIWKFGRWVCMEMSR